MKLILTDIQKRRAQEALRSCLDAPPDEKGRTPIEKERELDGHRVQVIDATAAPLLYGFLQGKVDLKEFKKQVDSINKKNNLWGFRGAKGQLFFNQLANACGGSVKLEAELRAALVCPKDNGAASKRIADFASFVLKIAERHKATPNGARTAPKASSVPFFLSYFWQIQNRDVWPVFYTNSVQIMGDLDLWQPTGDLASDYISFKSLHEELVISFGQIAGRPFTLYDVEHVFWFKSGRPIGIDVARTSPSPSSRPARVELIEQNLMEIADHLPDSYVPPIVAVIPQLAASESRLEKTAKASYGTIARALEKHIHAAFSILGYETKLLGQGSGRVPDGIAICREDSYAILWDAKAHAEGYSIGTDDRTINDYITTLGRELKRKHSITNLYYVIISSKFNGDSSKAIRMLKMKTDIKEICLMEAEALVVMIEKRLRSPLEIGLGTDGLQRLFSSSGIITAENVRLITE